MSELSWLSSNLLNQGSSQLFYVSTRKLNIKLAFLKFSFFSNGISCLKLIVVADAWFINNSRYKETKYKEFV